MTPQRLEDLIQGYVSETLNSEDLEELSTYLQRDSSRDARRKLRLALEADAYLQEAAAEEESPKKASLVPSRVLWLGIGGIAAALAFGIASWLGTGSESPPEDSVASVIRISGSNDLALVAGSSLKAGDVLTMEEGVVEAAFQESGVHFIASGPLSLTVTNSDHVFLHHGEIKLHVPPQGIGFVVETDERSITDLGTSFVVSAQETQSKVLVLDGLISVSDHRSGHEQLMAEGELARFGLEGAMELRTLQHTDLPEISSSPAPANTSNLPGRIFAYPKAEGLGNPAKVDLIGPEFLPLVSSQFQSHELSEKFTEGSPLHFDGIAGAFSRFPKSSGLGEYQEDLGWMAWYSGSVSPPAPGRYRFWGYADNHLLVAINGKPVFDGSRYDSALRAQLGVFRRDHPSLPCLNAPAGFASGDWFEVRDTPVDIDILFGEIIGDATSGLLLIEREGESYTEAYWGQPQWPVFLTAKPSSTQAKEFDEIRLHMEEKMMGTFSISDASIWTPTAE